MILAFILGQRRKAFYAVFPVSFTSEDQSHFRSGAGSSLDGFKTYCLDSSVLSVSGIVFTVVPITFGVLGRSFGSFILIVY